VDDSIFMRKIVSDVLNSDPEIEVCDIARNGIEAIEKIKELKPDAVTMDIEMPRMDGLTALEHIMRECPVPIIMLSTLTQRGADATLKALDLGAVDYVPKPSGAISLDVRKVGHELIEKSRSSGLCTETIWCDLARCEKGRSRTDREGKNSSIRETQKTYATKTSAAEIHTQSKNKTYCDWDVHRRTFRTGRDHPPLSSRYTSDADRAAHACWFYSDVCREAEY